MVSEERRGKDYSELEDEEAVKRIVNKVNFDRGKIKERRKMANPIKKTWLFVNEDGSHNDLGQAMLLAFAGVYKSKMKNPSYNDVFEKFWSSVGKKVPAKKNKKGEPFTEADWKKKGQTFLKGYVAKGMKQQGKKVDGRVSMLLKSGRGSATQRQRDEAVSFFAGLGAFTEETYSGKTGKTISAEEAVRLGSVEARQTTLI